MPQEDPVFLNPNRRGDSAAWHRAARVMGRGGSRNNEEIMQIEEGKRFFLMCIVLGEKLPAFQTQMISA